MRAIRRVFERWRVAPPAIAVAAIAVAAIAAAAMPAQAATDRVSVAASPDTTGVFGGLDAASVGEPRWTLEIPTLSPRALGLLALALAMAGWRLAKRFPRSAAVLAATLVAPHALASDGVLEIHQACVAAGCFPGDSPGFPVELATSGSYVLTSNLQVPDANTSAIQLGADDIHIDLGGFTISGVTDCGANTGDPCSPAATSAAGIQGVDWAESSVRNGSIRGMGGFGATLGNYSRVEALHTSHNGVDGIWLRRGGIVARCISRRNGRYGIRTGTSSVVTHSIAARNNANGLRFSSGSVAIGNSLSFNAGAGLDGDVAAAYAQNTLLGNADGAVANQVSGSVSQLGPNLCSANPCP